MSTQSVQAAKRANAYPSPPPQSQTQQAAEPWFIETPVDKLLEALDVQDPGRVTAQPDEFELTQFVPDPTRDQFVRDVAAVMQLVRANRTMRLQHVAYRLSQTWAEGLWQLGASDLGDSDQTQTGSGQGPVHVAQTSAAQTGDRPSKTEPTTAELVRIMSGILSIDQKKLSTALEGLANTVITPELLAEFDGLIDAIEACLTHAASLSIEDAGPCRPRPELFIAFAAIRLREHSEYGVDESEHRRLMEALTHNELAQKLIASQTVAKRLGSVLAGPNPAHVMRWVFQLDKIPMVSFAGEQAKLAAIGTIFEWIATLRSTDPETVAGTFKDKQAIAGAVLAKS